MLSTPISNAKIVAMVDWNVLICPATPIGELKVATMPEARRKGIGTAMTLDPLLQAREDGYNVGVLHSSEMGQPVYERMGFKRICDFWFYRWTPEPQE